ncbi:Yip1 domain-containing protein [Dyella jiangningensis]|uniref:Yip1 family protein n=1 Tax=Dyella sp. AtDHG13 TaxID=1938897 RepID=UPI00088189FA|nr:Yip1 family protein [Dyella sp. AtDHG13]PXV59228.1 Yip1-like protein [Dyella sp. AtDHG13]SDK26657.1 Yip1 domain-containing protein [Dyella jiangningensis]
MDFTKIVERIKAILASPRTEWPVIAAEPATVGGLFRNYICIVAALPVIAHFIRGSLIGYGGFGVHVHTPIGMGVLGMLLHYALTLAVTYVLAIIVDALAPSFGGTKDSVQALKTVAYAWTAGWVAGIAVIIPWLGWLVAIAGAIYGIYLLYLGLPHTMRCPADRAGGYAAVTVIIAIVMSWIVGMIVGGTIGTAVLTGASMTGMHAGDGSTLTVDPDSALGKLSDMGANTARAAKDLENAQKTGDVAAQQAAMGKLMSGDSKTVVTSLSPRTLQGFLPDELDGMKRSDFNAQRSGAMGMQISTARATYSDGRIRTLQVEVADTGNMRGMMAVASAMTPAAEEQTDRGYDKTYTDHDRLVHESWSTQTKSGEFSVVVANRFTVKASGNAEDIDQLKQAVNDLDLGRLASLKNEGVSGP